MMEKTIRYSKLQTGWVRHRRNAPKQHSFRIPLFMLYLDLDEIEEISRTLRFFSIGKFNWLSFHRADYVGDKSIPLKQAVIREITENSSVQAEQINRIGMLSQIRMFGFVFNPVTFYFAFDHNDQLLLIMPEITNTPWSERFRYFLPVSESLTSSTDKYQFRPNKQFHVSPFHPMNMQYNWRFANPENDSHVIHLENWQHNELIFDATLNLRSQPLENAAVTKTLIRFPLMTVKVVTGIYINALKLWLKGVPFYRHPNKNTEESGT